MFDKTSTLPVLFRILGALCCGVVAWIIGHQMGLPAWSSTAIVADNMTFAVFTALAVIFLTHPKD